MLPLCSWVGSFERGERDGGIVNLQVTDAALIRALLLADLLMRTAEGLGWSLETPPPAPEEPDRPRSRWDPPILPIKPKPPIAHLVVEGEAIEFRIEERQRLEARQPTPAELAREKRDYSYHAPRIQQIPTGVLRVVRIDSRRYWGPKRKTWYDRSRRPVEAQIPKILAGFHELAQELKARHAEAERQRLLHEEEERVKQERQDRREAHAKLIADLERQAGAWHRARYLRRYVLAARRTIKGKQIHAQFRDETIDFLDWAAAYVDHLDPLSAAPHNPDLTPEPNYYYRANDEVLKESLQRLFGIGCQHARKLLRAGLLDTNAEENV